MLRHCAFQLSIKFIRNAAMGDLEVKSLAIQGNILQATFNVVFEYPRPQGILFGASRPLPQKNDKKTRYSAKHIINYVCFETKAELSIAFGLRRSSISVKFSKAKTNDDGIYSIHLISSDLRLNKNFFCDDTEWRFIFENNLVDYSFDVSVQVERITPLFKIPRRISLPNFAVFDNDDLRLNGTDGSVSINSAVLAASSPAVRGVLEEKCQGTENRILEIPETSKAALQHLKNYLYLNVLPENGVQLLLPLASCFLMEDLKNQCIDKIITSLNAQNAVEISKFALAHNIMELYYAVLERVQSDSVKVSDIRECSKL